MTDFRALCAELIDQLKQSAEVHWNYGFNKAARQCDAVVERASTALADEPASVISEPSDEEIMELWHGSDWYNEGATLREFLSIARAVLARWSRHTPVPVPVSERWPGAKDCDEEGIRAALTDLIHDLELADWPRHLKDKFREDLIRARITLLSSGQNLSRMRVTQGQGCTDQASH